MLELCTAFRAGLLLHSVVCQAMLTNWEIVKLESKEQG